MKSLQNTCNKLKVSLHSTYESTKSKMSTLLIPYKQVSVCHSASDTCTWVRQTKVSDENYW